MEIIGKQLTLRTYLLSLFEMPWVLPYSGQNRDQWSSYFFCAALIQGWVTPMTRKVRDTLKMVDDSCMAENIYII